MLIISRKDGESFYVDDVLFTGLVESEHFITLECEGKYKMLETGQSIDLRDSPWELQMQLVNIRVNLKVHKVVIGCAGPREVVVLRKELVC